VAPPARILGIDPGLNRTGWGVIESAGGRIVCVDAGVIRVPAGALPQRIAAIFAGLRQVIDAAQPTRASVEKVFVNVNPQSTLLLGQARGAAICAAVTAGLAVREHTALQVKQAVVGYGKASKVQVQTMVQRLLGLAELPSTDAADALACAVCDLHAERLLAVGGPLLSAASRGRRSRNAWRRGAARLLG
jgi:crossover junction endodeoxyribonuclease RuvC